MSSVLVKPVRVRAPRPARPRSQPHGWCSAIILATYLMIVLDVSVVITALPEHPELAALLAHRPLVGAERLHADLRRPAAAGRPRRRHPRPPADVRGRHRRSSPPPRWRAASRRPPAWLLAARAVQGVGAAIAAPSTLALLTTTFREGAERTRAIAVLQRRRRRRRQRRPRARRHAHRLALVALGPLHQRARRPRADRPRAALPARDARAVPAASTSPARSPRRSA